MFLLYLLYSHQIPLGMHVRSYFGIILSTKKIEPKLRELLIIIIIVITMLVGKIVKRLLHKNSNLKPQSKMVGRMADKIDAMKQTLNKTSPKIFSILMMLTTVPTFYFGYKMITLQYGDKQFTTATNAGINYINIKNLIFFACLSTLQKFKFTSPTAKHTLPRIGMFGAVIPPLLSFLCLCLPSSDNKYIVLPTFISDIFMVIVEAQVANFGSYPFWLYSYRHFIRFFDWFILISTFFALRNLQKRVKSHPHEFVQVKQKQKQTEDQQN